MGNYYNVGLYEKDTPVQVRINILVAEHFIYNNDPINKPFVDHVDNNKLNNNASMLISFLFAALFFTKTCY